jgi:hypothetical protein
MIFISDSHQKEVQLDIFVDTFSRTFNRHQGKRWMHSRAEIRWDSSSLFQRIVSARQPSSRRTYSSIKSSSPRM